MATAQAMSSAPKDFFTSNRMYIRTINTITAHEIAIAAVMSAFVPEVTDGRGAGSAMLVRSAKADEQNRGMETAERQRSAAC